MLKTTQTPADRQVRSQLSEVNNAARLLARTVRTLGSCGTTAEARLAATRDLHVVRERLTPIREHAQHSARTGSAVRYLGVLHYAEHVLALQEHGVRMFRNDVEHLERGGRSVQPEHRTGGRRSQSVRAIPCGAPGLGKRA